MPAIDYEFNKYHYLDDGGPNGPTPSVDRFMTGAIVQGSIPSLPVPAPNSTYTLTFPGPLIQCRNSSSDINQQVHNYMKERYIYSKTFVGFRPLTDNISHAMHTVLYGYAGPDNADRDADVAEKLIMSFWPYMPAYNRWVIECGMYNASWTVSFDFTNGVQSTHIQDLRVLNRVRSYSQHAIPTPPNEDQLFAYSSLMTAFSDSFEGFCSSSMSICTDTKIYSSALINSKQIWEIVFDEKVGNKSADTLPSILDAAQELGRNITLSLYANPYFMYSPPLTP